MNTKKIILRILWIVSLFVGAVLGIAIIIKKIEWYNYIVVAFVLLVGLIFFLYERSIAEEQRIENLPEAERALERVQIKEKDDRELKERMHSINTWNSIKLIIGLIVLIVVMLIEYFKI